jgi:hypothetical protein
MTPRERIAGNPFLVLGLATTASRIEVEREGGKLLGMLELGMAGAREYATPLGPQPRTPEKVREAMAILRDPARRLAAELWAAGLVIESPRPGGPPASPASGPSLPASAPTPWPPALRALGWRRRGAP